MLRELNENEMMMVSGGSVNGGYKSGYPGTEQWDKDSEFAQGGSNGTYAQDTGGFGSTATGILKTVTPRGSDFNPANIGGGHISLNWGNIGADGFRNFVFYDSQTGWLWGDIGADGSVDGPARLVNGNYWVDSDNNGSFDTNIGSSGYNIPTGQ